MARAATATAETLGAARAAAMMAATGQRCGGVVGEGGGEGSRSEDGGEGGIGDRGGEDDGGLGELDGEGGGEDGRGGGGGSKGGDGGGVATMEATRVAAAKAVAA